MRKKKISATEVIRRIAIVLCVLVFLGCAVYLAMYAYESYQNSKASELTFEQYVSVQSGGINANHGDIQVSTSSGEAETVQYLSVDFDALKAVNEDVFGWIQVSGLDKISYPLVWCADNAYYLEHSWDKQSSRYGALFLDENNANDLSDAYSLIYGHNMKDGSMFGGLKKYRNADFYAEHGGLITVYLPGQIYTYQIFSVRQVSADAQSAYTVGFAHDATFNTYVQYMADHSMYDTGVSVSSEDKVLTLSTCSGDDRLVVHAKLISVDMVE